MDGSNYSDVDWLVSCDLKISKGVVEVKNINGVWSFKLCVLSYVFCIWELGIKFIIRNIKEWLFYFWVDIFFYYIRDVLLLWVSLLRIIWFVLLFLL